MATVYKTPKFIEIAAALASRNHLTLTDIGGRLCEKCIINGIAFEGGTDIYLITGWYGDKCEKLNICVKAK